MSSASVQRKPNVIWVLTDDQGTLDVNCYGAKHLHTPVMDGLAREGLRFTRAYSHTVCCPARANLLTGRHSQRVGINHWTQAQAEGKRGINIHPDEVTAATIFKRHGYCTGLFGKWHLGAAEGNRPLDMGFDEFFGFLGGFIENYTHYSLHGTGFHDLWDGAEEIDARDAYYPRMTNDRALDFIERHKDEPFFLYLPYNLPHYPEQSEEKFGTFYQDADERVRKYGMTVSTVDGLIGEVLQKVDALGLTDDTIVLFMSDNGHSEEDYRIAPNHTSGLPEGWFYGTHGAGYAGPFKGQKGNFTEGGIRVPCILKAPGLVEPGSVSERVVCGLDWLPTTLSLCGIDHTFDRPLDGVDLSTCLTGDEGDDAIERVLHLQWYDGWMVMRGDWKLIGSNSKPERQLFRVDCENPEGTSYARGRLCTPVHEQVKQELEALHTDWFAEVREGYEGPRACAEDRE